MTLSDFVNRELILFAVAHNRRNIPSVVDGLKLVQRKILYCCLKLNLTMDIQIVTVCTHVKMCTSYHHGETSMSSAIVLMARDYVGSNNLPLLGGEGQYGTRLAGGAYAPNPR